MAALLPFAPLIAAGVGLAGTAATILTRPKPPKPVVTQTRNLAAERAAANDGLARRTGARANRRTPYGGAEASARPKASLLGRT